MELTDFVDKFASEFDETPMDLFNPSTVYKDLDEWGSLTALSIISMVDEEFEVCITGEDIRKNETIEDLYQSIQNK